MSGIAQDYYLIKRELEIYKVIVRLEAAFENFLHSKIRPFLCNHPINLTHSVRAV